MNIQSTLKKFGLTEDEATVYTALLKIIEAPVYTIAREAGLPRTTTYTVLDALAQQGLVLRLKKNNILHYTAESPKQLERLMEEKNELVKSLVPELQALIDTSPFQPGLKIYEGLSGVKTVREDILETLRKEKNKELLSIANDTLYKILPRYFPYWVKKRVEYGISAKLILPYSEKNNEHYNNQNNKETRRESRFLPAGIAHDCSINIYGNKVSLLSMDKKITSVVMESKQVAHLFRQFFLFNWDILK